MPKKLFARIFYQLVLLLYTKRNEKLNLENILNAHTFAETTAKTKRVCPGRDSNPHVRCHTQDFKSCASAISPPGHLGDAKINIFMKITINEKRYFF
ncbi:MAG: hypothetical protein RL348_829 [Bacteroidota bacterium]